MELKTDQWKEFRLDRLFSVRLAKGDVKVSDIDDGLVPLVSSGETNNGIVAHVSETGDGISEIFSGNVLTLDMFCHAFYQADDFFAVSHGRVNILVPLFPLNQSIGLFLATILNADAYKYSYGRALYSGMVSTITLRLPIQHNIAGQPVIDPDRKYSDDGYVPDWDFMEQYMKSLNTQPLVTQRGGSALPTLGVDQWKEFQVGRLFQLNIARSVDYGNTTEGSTVFVGRTSENNGIQGYVSEFPVENENCIIIGMVGSNWAFYQDKPFAASQNILVLRNDMLNRSIAMFLCTVLSKCVEIYRDTYSLPLGKEKIKSRGIKLPVQHDASGQPLIDPLKKYSDDGYIPDWAFMEQYIGSLPGSDLI